MSTPRQQVEQEPCRCVQCSYCNGSGHLWFDLGGRYLGNHRSDDLDNLEPCDSCGGSGIIETCDRCQLLSDMDHEGDAA
jgi:hypothetical protein